MTDYQNEAQVEQLLAFRATAKAYGQTDNVASADKQLAAFGIVTKEDREAAAKHRRAAAEAAAAPAEEPKKDEAPKGRSAAKKTTASAS